MKLAELLAAALPDRDQTRIEDIEVTGLNLDSRKIVAGDLFLALPGSQRHGLEYARQAIANGAVAVAFDPVGCPGAAPAGQDGVPFIAVADLAEQVGAMAARFYGYPARDMAVIGITGTNGKTSCSQFLAQLLDDCGVVGTLGWGRPGALQPTVNTTPDAVSLQAMLAVFRGQGMKTVAMEVSSHGLRQGRVNGIDFNGAVYTNISRDHLDYHLDMASYLSAKLKLLAMPGLAFAVVNLDDAHAGEILAAAPPSLRLWGISRSERACLQGETLSASAWQCQAQGMTLIIHWRGQSEQLSLPLYGEFNVENALSVLAVLLALGGEFSESVQKLAGLTAIPGRMESFGGNGQPLVFVDYAHTPDALEKVLQSARRHCQGRLWVVFGCGGNRDAGKRPLMRQAAERFADQVVITDDNPRFESGLAIINDIMASSRALNIEVIEDRQEAIEDVIARADNGDCIVVAGKGHEAYQEINGERIPFSDQLVVMDALTKRL